MIETQNFIFIKGAREHNLKNIDVHVPVNQLVVVTGVSGSGKSSLIIDTLYAEGQRRYVESLSAYARQFLMRMNKPDVDFITGISPAIAIEQRASARTSRSTVGSLTEIYDYLRLLYARIGRTFSPVSGQEVRRHQVGDVVDFVMKQKPESQAQILAPLRPFETKKNAKSIIQQLLQRGFTRLRVDSQTMKLEEVTALEGHEQSDIALVVDRIALEGDSEALAKRVADSVLIAFEEGFGTCDVEVIGKKVSRFSNRFELDGIRFDEPTPHLFNYNNPFGACPKCEGFGSIIGIDPELVIPDPTLSVYEEAIACWKGEKMSKWRDRLVKTAMQFDFPIHREIRHLTKDEYKLLWTGNEHFRGINEFFQHIEEQSYKIQYRVMLSRYRGRTTCDECEGRRLRKEALCVKVHGHDVSELMTMPVGKLRTFFDELALSDYERQVSARILTEITSRLDVMIEVGLGYLTPDRTSSTLSGGEMQRINLTRTLGSNLTSSLYILDEPSIGLHPRDTMRLINTLKKLRDLGNTVVVIEHDEDMMRSADYLIEMGPLAGVHGGEVVISNRADELFTTSPIRSLPATNTSVARTLRTGEGSKGGDISSFPPVKGGLRGVSRSLTLDYLSGAKGIPIPKQRRKVSNKIIVKGASQHNLKDITVTFPLNTLTVVTGVSGSGKTTLVKHTLYPFLERHLTGQGERPGHFKEIVGDIDRIKHVELIDQDPIGRSSRSNPVTYVKAYDAIRELYASQQLSKIRGYEPKHFSFNVDGGRCDACKGEGEIIVEMQFLADVHLTCEDCNGKRFKHDVLEVRYKQKSIFDVLQMSIEEALEFFKDKAEIISRIKPLNDVGLGYVQLGQSSSTLSGGEAQRVKLASFLTRGQDIEPILFFFDEPTTGLHFHDIQKLLDSLNALIEAGHSVVVIEHNPEVIKCADWVIDLGPEGGEEGGYLVYQGTPEGLAGQKKSETGRFLRLKIEELKH